MRSPAFTLSLALVVASSVAMPGRAQQDPTVRALTTPWPETVKVDGIEILRVRKDIYMLVGGGANVTVQIGDEGVLLVDAGGVGQADKILAAIRHLTPRKPLRYLVNTNADADHVGGNQGIVQAAGGTSGAVAPVQGRPANTGIYTFAHENAVTRMMAGSPALPPLTGEALPQTTFFTARKDFYSNGEAVQLFFQPHAHTDGDLIVFFRGSDVVSAGDVFRTDRFPMIDAARGGTIQGELDALNAILDLTIPERNAMGGTRVVPGHGRICNEADVLEYRDMVTIVRDRVRDMVKKNMTLQQVKAARPLIEYDGLYGTARDWTGDMFLEVVYNDLSKKK